MSSRWRKVETSNGVINFLRMPDATQKDVVFGERGRNAPRHAQINLRFTNKQGAGFNYLPTDWLIDPEDVLLSRAIRYGVNTQFTSLHTFATVIPAVRSRVTHARCISLIYFSLMTDRWVGAISAMLNASVFNILFAILIRYLDFGKRRGGGRLGLFALLARTKSLSSMLN